jgi:flagellar M-ring protein FliF
MAPEGEQEAASSALDLKRDTERMLARKATEVLERAVGAGQALATVDVSLNMDQVRVTTEDVLGSPASAGHAMSGVMVRQRETIRDVTAPLNNRGAERLGNSQREIDYQVGRRVEQVVTQPGAIRRLHAVAMISQVMNEAQTEQMRLMLAAAVGAVPERGDTVIVQSLRGFEPASQQDMVEPVHSSADVFMSKPMVSTSTSPNTQPSAPVMAAAAFAVLLVAAIGGWALLRRRRNAAAPLTAAQRRELLDQMREWLDGVTVAGPRTAGQEVLGKGLRP